MLEFYENGLENIYLRILSKEDYKTGVTSKQRYRGLLKTESLDTSV